VAAEHALERGTGRTLFATHALRLVVACYAFDVGIGFGRSDACGCVAGHRLSAHVFDECADSPAGAPGVLAGDNFDSVAKIQDELSMLELHGISACQGVEV